MLVAFILSSLLLLSQHVHAQTKVVRILLDSDPSIDYEPAEFWHSSLVPCDDCPKIDPSLTYNNTGTFHNGTHSEPFTDPDDLTGKPDSSRKRGRRKRSGGRPPNAGGNGEGEQEAPAGPTPTPTPTPSSTTTTTTSSKSSSSSVAQQQQQQQQSSPPAQQQQQQQQQQSTTTTTTTTSGANSKSGTATLPTSGPGFTSGPDADDGNFVPDTVSVTFRFTGQSAQVHAIVPNFVFPGMLSTTNVSFFIDGVDTGLPFIFKPVAGNAGSSSFTPKMILNIGSLNDGPHVLVAKVAPLSVLIFDYLNYTAWSTDPLPSPGGSSTATAPGHELTGGSTPVTKHNVLTFALAVGLSVGLLFIGAVVLWINIWRRRVNSRRRLKRLEEEEADNARRFGLDPEEVRGPIPFMPRYFPGTVPPSPPPYEGAAPAEPQTPAAVTTTHSLSSPVTLQRFPLPPETRQPMSTPAVSISRSLVSIPGSTSNRTEGTDRRHSIISTGSVNIPFNETDERVASPIPPGLVMPRPTRISSPTLLTQNLEEEEASSGAQVEQHRPRSIRSTRSRRVGSPASGTGVESALRGRREDEMSDTESGALLRSSSLSSNSRRLRGGVGDGAALEPYHDEPPHTVNGPDRNDDVR